MSSASLFPATASGGHDWLYADPFAYQYSEIPEHISGIQSRTPSPAPAGGAVCELEGSSPAQHNGHGATSPQRIELEGCTPRLPAVIETRQCFTTPPSPVARSAVEPGPAHRYIPAALTPGHPQAHVLSSVKHSELVRSRHANVRLSRRYLSHQPPHHHRRMMTESAVPLPLPPPARAGTLPPPPPPQFAPGSAPPAARGAARPPPQPQPQPKPRRLMPIRTDVGYEPGLILADERTPTPKKDFDAILRDIEPTPKKTKWRHSRAIAYQEKYRTWGA